MRHELGTHIVAVAAAALALFSATRPFPLRVWIEDPDPLRCRSGHYGATLQTPPDADIVTALIDELDHADRRALAITALGQLGAAAHAATAPLARVAGTLSGLELARAVLSLRRISTPADEALLGPVLERAARDAHPLARQTAR